MSSDKRNQSNRLNALRSTGPKTPAGKLASSGNAMRHGAYSEALTMLLENPESFATLRTGMVDTFLPIGAMEEGLVDRMASLWWRMERAKVAANQSLWMSAKRKTLDPDFAISQADELIALEADECRVSEAWSHETQERLLRHEMALERSFFRLLHELERLQAKRQGHAVLPPVSLDVTFSGAGD